MTKNALGFRFETGNRQSTAVLIGTIQQDPRFANLDIHLVKPRNGLARQIVALAAKYDQVVIGFSFTTPEAISTWEAVRAVRDILQAKQLDNVALIAGGPHPSGNWRQTLAMGFDIVVIGEGEIVFPELLDVLYQGEIPVQLLADESGLDHIPGLAFFTRAGTCCTGRARQVECLDDYPPFAPEYSVFSSIEITRGCPWACKYCQNTFLKGANMRHRSIENIVKWATLSKERDHGTMRFITPDAFAYGSDGRSRKLKPLSEMLRAVCRVAGKEYTYLGSFPSEVRPDSVSPEALALICEFAANDNILIGAQSGSDRMLGICHRGHTVDDVFRAVELTTQSGLIAKLDFIFGMPGETAADVEQTLKVIKDLARMGARIHSHTFMPLAGTPWANTPAGTMDGRTRSLLESLTGTGQHFGRWRTQRTMARAIEALRNAEDKDFTRSASRRNP